MGDEQLQVLQMVAAGTITPEQGEDLLSALETSHSQVSVPATERRQTGDWSGVRTSRGVLTRLSEARLLGVTPEFIRGLTALGYGDLQLEQYIALRSHGITSEFVQEMRESGYGDMSIDDLIALRVSGVNSDYVREMLSLGLGDPASPQLADPQPNVVEAEER